MTGGQQRPRWFFLITPRWLAWHLFVVVAFFGMLLLGEWQFHRAEAGNSLSWAYTFEWPIFAVLGVAFWVKTIVDEFKPQAAGPATEPEVSLPAGARQPAASTGSGAAADPDDDSELADYNAYLARLNEQVKGHGRWHGLR